MAYMSQGYRMLLRAAGRTHFAFSVARDAPTSAAASAVKILRRWNNVEHYRGYNWNTARIAAIEYQKAENLLMLTGYMEGGKYNGPAKEY